MRSLFDAPAISVGELCRRIRSALRGQFPTTVRVLGEITRSRTIDGAVYFALKDRQGLIECYCFKDAAARLPLRFPIADGTAVEVTGNVGIYEPKSAYQLRVVDIVPVGTGALYMAFERLKAALAAEGLFDASRKREIPAFIRDVAIVTSRNASVLQDFVTTCQRRGAHVRIHLVHTPVNGVAAAPAVARAIHKAGQLAVDVVVIARGGGAPEDLWAFNTELVARAIASCAKPVISAIGHETDVTIADFVADRRAATPTAAAEFVAQERAALLRRVAAAHERARRALLRSLQVPRSALLVVLRDLMREKQELLSSRRQRVDDLVLSLRRADPRRRTRMWTERAATAQSRLTTLVPRWLARERERVNRLQRDFAHACSRALAGRASLLELTDTRLRTLGPRRTLERGYAIVYDAVGDVLVDSKAVRLGENIAVELKSGALGATVREKKDDHGENRREEDT